MKTDQKERWLTAGKLKIYPESYKVYREDKEIDLTRREFEILVLFARNPGIVFTRERIFDHIWGMEAVGDMSTVTSTVTVHVNKLREKIEKDSSEPEMIQTVWGVGYRFRG